MKQIVKKIRKAYCRVLDYYPTTINGLKFKCDPHYIWFWREVSSARWEPQTFNILTKFLKSNFIFCDIGAWIGLTVIYSARKLKQVFCFEPDFIAYEHLLWNIRLNGLCNVMPFNAALTNYDDIRKMGSFGKSIGDSMTSLLIAEKIGNIDVWCMK